MRRFLVVAAATAILATIGWPQPSRAGPIEVAQLDLLLHPWLLIDLPPEPEVTFLPNSLPNAVPGNYTFLVGATLNGVPFASPGSSVPASIYFSPAPGGSTGLVPGTAMQIPDTTIIQQNVDVNFNVVNQTFGGPIVLLAGEIRGLISIDTSKATGSIAIEPFPQPWLSDLVYSGIPNLRGIGTLFTLSDVAALSGGLGITSQGNITPLSADGVGQFSVVPEPSSCVLAGLGLGVIVVSSLVRRRVTRT
jgi:hypothetical protein